MTKFHEGQEVEVHVWFKGEIVGRHGKKYLVQLDGFQGLRAFDFDEKDIRAIEPTE
jgi:hypothetical protein